MAGCEGCRYADMVLRVVMMAMRVMRIARMAIRRLGVDPRHGDEYREWVGRRWRMYGSEMTNALAACDMIVQRVCSQTAIV